MNAIDVTVLALLAAADVCLIAFLRRRRARYLRMDRMARSLELHIRRELSSEVLLARPRRQLQGRTG